MADEFLAQSLNSRQLLALLYVLECDRKHVPLTLEGFKSNQPPSWEDLLSTFAVRFANLAEDMRFQVLEAHLMSVEDLDVYHNETLEKLLTTHRPMLDHLTAELTKDPRFSLGQS